MSPLKPSSFSLTHSWPHYAGLVATIFAIVMGIGRYTLLDRLDPDHCGALMSRGRWLDSSKKIWQPDGCMPHAYRPTDCALCFDRREIVFIGDSITRKLFFQFATILDPALPTAPSDDTLKHSDHSLSASLGARIAFYWDPFLNSTRTQRILAKRPAYPLKVVRDPTPPALLVLGGGLWNLRYSGLSGGIPAWEANMENILESISRNPSSMPDRTVILPVEEVIPSKLSRDRVVTMQSFDIDAMNSDLFHRVSPPSGDYLHLFASPPPPLPVSFPLVFNQMLDASQTDDGLHFSDSVVKAQANILLNLRCNDQLPKTFPMNKTCCRSYPRPTLLQLLVLFVMIAWGPSSWLSQSSGSRRLPPIKAEHVPPLVFSGAVLLLFVADRTGLWLKEQKTYSPYTFAFLCLASLVVGFATVKRADNDLGFMNREQTDEWKGWMQVAVLVYHYLAASKISGIYNPIRVLVAAYLFMTGYGHTMFYLRKADFGFLRVAQVLIRLNLLTVLLAYTMNTDYISYYFAPLVSLWFLVIYATLAIGSKFNDRTPILMLKIFISAGAVTWFMNEPWLLEGLFQILSQVCAIHWSAREWAFRVNLDLWIVYVGMFTAIGVIKLREHRLMEHTLWPLAVKLAAAISAIALLGYFVFELRQESKFTYNLWHPYISFVPVLAFAGLRNANVILRSASSGAFAFIGRCSLETFIIQHHIWLAGDAKGVLLVIPGTRWRPVNFVITTIIFVYVSHRISQATGEVTKWICGETAKGLPLPTTAAAAPQQGTSALDEVADVHEMSPMHKSNRSTRPSSDRTAPPPPPWLDRLAEGPFKSNQTPSSDTTEPPPTPRWLDRLADGASPPENAVPKLKAWKWNTPSHLGVKVKLVVGLSAMWLMNVLWTYP